MIPGSRASHPSAAGDDTPAPLAFRTALLRLLAGLLVVFLGLVLYLSLYPPVLSAVLRAAPIPGSVPIPTPGPTPPLPIIAASPGSLPTGFQAYTGVSAGEAISCGFLLELGDGKRVGVTAAHSSPSGGNAEFYAPGGARVAVLPRQISRGQTFTGDQFTQDYVLWSVAPSADPARFLQPDLRSLPQPGEPVYLYAPAAGSDGGPLRWPGVVVSAESNAVWVQLENSFSPVGYSGCPVVSRVTGRLLGMALAGADHPPVVIGLHPVASLVEKARAVLP